MSTNNESLSIEDAVFLIPREKPEQIRTQAENAWLNGCDADANPYCKDTQRWEHRLWYAQWILCNKYT